MTGKRFLAAMLAVLMTLGFAACSPAPQVKIISSARYIGQARGFLVTSDEMLSDAASPESLRAGLREMTELASQSKLNTIFLEVRQGASASYVSAKFPMDRRIPVEGKEQLDPLAELMAEAQGRQVQVFAVINPFGMGGSLPDGAANPFAGIATVGDSLDPADTKLHKLVAEDTAALVKKYHVDGVVLEGLDAAFTNGEDAEQGIEGLVRAVSAAVLGVNDTLTIGIAFDACNEKNNMTVELGQRLTADRVISMVMPAISGTLESVEQGGYMQTMQRWVQADLGLADIYTLNRFSEEQPDELAAQLLANAMQGGISGSVIAPYGFLRNLQPGEREQLVSLLAAGGSLSEIGLSIEPTLAVTYPTNGSTVYDNTVWVMGTSDPGQPLSLDGDEVERGERTGTFGVAVKLESGKNEFVFKNGEQGYTLVVNRGSSPTTPQTIERIPAGSLFPTSSLGVDSNETIQLEITAPAGASISATMGGKTVVLQQSTATTAIGRPVVFKGSFTLDPSEYPTGAVTNIGAVTYVVSLGGEHIVQKSQGEVFVAGRDVPLVLQIKDGQYVASVLTNPADEDSFTQSLKEGARFNSAGKTRVTRGGYPAVAYKLEGGGYVMSDKTTVVEDVDALKSNISAITKTQGDGWEEYAFEGGQPAVLASLEDNKLTLRMMDTTMDTDPAAAIAGGIVRSVERVDSGGAVELTLTFAEGGLWGYDITHGDGTTRLYLRQPPIAGGGYGKPLEGVEILIDPGHGGPDPGAMGVAGELGPTEAVLNMAYAAAVRFRLEQLGAAVSMTRVGEPQEKVTLDERTFQAQEERPHIFLSLHHNSAALNRDLSEVRHMEAYYWEAAAEPFAARLMERMGAALERPTSDPENAYYYVTRLTFAPAVLFELGFVINPQAYEQCCNPSNLYRAANAIAQAVVDTVSGKS